MASTAKEEEEEAENNRRLGGLNAKGRRGGMEGADRKIDSDRLTGGSRGDFDKMAPQIETIQAINRPDPQSVFLFVFWSQSSSSFSAGEGKRRRRRTSF